MISATVIRIFVADRADDSDLVGHLRQFRNGFAKMNAWNGGRDRPELAANFFGGVRLRIEGLVMRRPAIQPDHDAIDLPGGRLALCESRRVCPEAQQIGKSETERRSQPELEKIPARDAPAVLFEIQHWLSCECFND